MSENKKSKREQSLSGLKEMIISGLPSIGLKIESAFGELTLGVAPQNIRMALKFLRDHPGCRFISFIDLCGVDWPMRSERFDVVYHLLSPRWNTRIRVKVHVDVDTPVPSVHDIYPAAEWFEREAYDMYGILFEGLPDLRRLLTDYGFEGFPLRKDFPLTGYLEVRYDDTQKRVIYEPLHLDQAFRRFDFMSPWEGMQTIPGMLHAPMPGDEKASPSALEKKD